MVNNLSQRTVYPMMEAATCPVSPRSRLYRLEPIGIGTPFTESLTSYVCRLARAHHVTMSSLFEEILVPALGKEYLLAPEHCSAGARLTSRALKLHSVNGVGGAERDWIAAVESLILGYDLRFLTLTLWSDVLTSRHLLRTSLAWCPECFEEDRINGRPIYLPLIWHLKVVQMCSHHRRQLVNTCPGCGKQLYLLARRAFPGHCSSCTTWLGSSNKPSPNPMSEAVIKWQEVVTTNVGELIANAPSLNSPTKDGIAKILQASIDKLFEGEMIRLARLLGKSKSTVCYWYHGKTRPTLEELLKICYCINVPLISMLLGNEHILGTLSQVRPLPKVHPPRVRRQPAERLNYSEIELKLRSLILDDIPPMSVREAAEIVGCGYRILHLKFPYLCHIIATNYKNAEKKRLENKLEHLETEVRHAVSELRLQGIYPSMKEVANFLGNPTILKGRTPPAILRKAIRQYE